MAGQPNLLFLMPDQLRADFLSCYGAEFIDTPNIDRLAAEGVHLTRHYVHKMCTPSNWWEKVHAWCATPHFFKRTLDWPESFLV